MSDDPVLLEHPADHVAVVRINRPDARNALNMEVRRRIADHMSALGTDPAIRCVILAGGEKAFAAGADIREMADADAIEMMRRGAFRLWQMIAACPKPMIAAVRGFALGGGCELAMHADIIVAGDTAKFGQPEIRIGIIPGGGGTQRLPRAVGKFKAMKFLLTGELISAQEADAMGLVSEVVPDAEVEARALALAVQIAQLAPIAAQQIKECVLAGQDMALPSALMLEAKAIQLCFASRDQKEGMAAFIEKRKAAFEGR
ncbi:MAG: enoyl-CoA hydratase/isomerase family protein [Proteobacteria bacterium]|nr:enoyl-CoA hydratase/isomerase family protein [Burkholderiales bacterium]